MKSETKPMETAIRSVRNRFLTPETSCRTKKLCADIVREVLASAMKNMTGKDLPSVDLSPEKRFKAFRRVMHGHVWPAPEVVGFSERLAFSRSYTVQKWRHGGKRDFVITSTHETASGRTEITVRRYPPTVLILVCAAILLIVVLMMRQTA